MAPSTMAKLAMAARTDAINLLMRSPPVVHPPACPPVRPQVTAAPTGPARVSIPLLRGCRGLKNTGTRRSPGPRSAGRLGGRDAGPGGDGGVPEPGGVHRDSDERVAVLRGSPEVGDRHARGPPARRLHLDPGWPAAEQAGLGDQRQRADVVHGRALTGRLR